jgi:hyperosmotically inducible protein
MKKRMISLFTMGALALSGAAFAAGDQSEAVLTTKVKAAMAKEKPSTLAKVHVNSEKSGTVTLTGSAKTQADKDRAETVAKNVQGVTSVVNNIEVKP